MLSYDGTLDYSDLTKRPVRLEDDPVPSVDAGFDAFKDYVLKYCVRPSISTFALMGTCNTHRQVWRVARGTGAAVLPDQQPVVQIALTGTVLWGR